MFEEDCDILVDEEGQAINGGNLSKEQKECYRKHHKTKNTLVNSITFEIYQSLMDKSTARRMFEYLCNMYEENQHIMSERLIVRVKGKFFKSQMCFLHITHFNLLLLLKKKNLLVLLLGFSSYFFYCFLSFYFILLFLFLIFSLGCSSKKEGVKRVNK
jgi:hypothetical protein